MKRHNSGFTIMEMMITVVIAAILAAVAIPSFRAGIAGNRVKSGAQAMFSAIIQARAEAMKYNGACNVFIEPVDTANWNRGWYVVADDPDPDGNAATSFCALDPDPAAADTFDITDLSDPEAHIIAIFDVGPDDPDDGSDDVNDPTDDGADYLKDLVFTNAPAGNITFNRYGRITSGDIAISICDEDDLALQKRTVSSGLTGLPEIKLDGGCP